MILLTSTVPPVIVDLFDRFLKESDPKSLVFIETAAEIEEGDKEWLEDDYNSWLRVGLAVTRYSIVGKTREKLELDLAQYDIVYVSGGNTFFCYRKCKKRGQWK